MAFEKGHPYYGGSGKKGRSGRKKCLTTLVKEAMEQNDERLPELFELLYAKAQGRDSMECPHCHKSFNDPTAGDREAIINLIDRSLGKVRAKTELEITRGEDLLGSGEVTKIFAMIDARKNEILVKFFTTRFGERDKWPEYAQQGIRALSESWAVGVVEPQQIAQGSQIIEQGSQEDEG